MHEAGCSVDAKFSVHYSVGDMPDDFFDMTTDDIQRLLAAQAAERMRQETGAPHTLILGYLV